MEVASVIYVGAMRFNATVDVVECETGLDVVFGQRPIVNARAAAVAEEPYTVRAE